MISLKQILFFTVYGTALCAIRYTVHLNCWCQEQDLFSPLLTSLPSYLLFSDCTCTTAEGVGDTLFPGLMCVWPERVYVWTGRVGKFCEIFFASQIHLSIVQERIEWIPRARTGRSCRHLVSHVAIFPLLLIISGTQNLQRMAQKKLDCWQKY